jgi:hypothetical protein
MWLNPGNLPAWCQGSLLLLLLLLLLMLLLLLLLLLMLIWHGCSF